jgi:hypothetical protein
VLDATEQTLAYVYGRIGDTRAGKTLRLEARRITANISKLPERLSKGKRCRKRKGLALRASPIPRKLMRVGYYPHSFMDAMAFLASSMLLNLPMDFIPEGILCIASHLWLAGSKTT